MAEQTTETPVEGQESKKEGRVTLSLEQFIEINEKVANGPTPTIAAIVEATGLAESTVRQRRTEVNALMKEHNFRLTDLPKGGRPKATPADLAAIAQRLLAKREEATKQETESETEA